MAGCLGIEGVSFIRMITVNNRNKAENWTENPATFIAHRHYSFPWHIMFLIKIAHELIKMFIQSLFPPYGCFVTLPVFE